MVEESPAEHKKKHSRDVQDLWDEIEGKDELDESEESKEEE
jgi:hypothetical protein